MTENVLVCVAWPYANAEIHVGNLTGSHLPGDIFARYQRLKGRQVMMVSGSDSHGTPITVRADAEKTTPLEVYQRFHNGFIDLFKNLASPTTCSPAPTPAITLSCAADVSGVEKEWLSL
jgi:methionyl-tRNA synthetase